MDDAVYKKYKCAGKIAGKARDYGITLIKEGAHVLEAVNKIESMITK